MLVINSFDLHCIVCPFGNSGSVPAGCWVHQMLLYCNCIAHSWYSPKWLAGQNAIIYSFQMVQIKKKWGESCFKDKKGILILFPDSAFLYAAITFQLVSVLSDYGWEIFIARLLEAESRLCSRPFICRQQRNAMRSTSWIGSWKLWVSICAISWHGMMGLGQQRRAKWE